jgi:hypothetical protein
VLAACLLIALAPVVCSGAAPAPLALVKPTLHQYEDGPTLPEDFLFGPGETVFLSFQIGGYKVSPDSSIHLACRIEAVDPAGVPLAEVFQREITAELTPEDKDWMPIVRHSVPTPPLGDPGTCRILVLVKDLLAGTETKAEIPFRLGGRQVAPSDTLAVRNFRFLRSEEDREPLPAAAYRPGDTLWARFEIRGYKYGPNNAVHVEYGLAVLGPSGKTLYTEPRAALEQTSSFYPKRYLPGSLSLNLQPNAKPGEYTIVLSVRDEIGKQVFEIRQPFRIQ